MKLAVAAVLALGVTRLGVSAETVDDTKTSVSKPISFGNYFSAANSADNTASILADEQRAAVVSAQLDRDSAQMIDVAHRSGALAPVSDEDAENEYLDNYYQTYYESVAFVPVVATAFPTDSPYAQVEFATPIVERFGAMEVLEVSPTDVARLEAGEILFVEDLDCAPQSRPVAREILDQFAETSIGYVPAPAPFDDEHLTPTERRELKAQILHKKMHLAKAKVSKTHPYPTNPVVKKYPVYQPRYKHVKKGKKKSKAVPYVYFSDSESCSESSSHYSDSHHIKYSKAAKTKALYMKHLAAQKYNALLEKKNTLKGKSHQKMPVVRPPIRPPIEESSEECSDSRVFYGKHSKGSMKKKYTNMQHKMIALKNKNAPYKAKYQKKYTHEL